MEQPAFLNIIRVENVYHFRLELPESPAQAQQEYVTELTPEMRERLRRALQAAAQYMQTTALTDVRRQTLKLGAVNDSLMTLGRFLFDTVLPLPLQDILVHLDTPLILNTNTAEIPWEVLYEG